jgi:hypothetical protein
MSYWIAAGQEFMQLAKRRLSHSGDFAYLLDALIYHLRIEGGKICSTA